MNWQQRDFDKEILPTIVGIGRGKSPISKNCHFLMHICFSVFCYVWQSFFILNLQTEYCYVFAPYKLVICLIIFPRLVSTGIETGLNHIHETTFKENSQICLSKGNGKWWVVETTTRLLSRQVSLIRSPL